jgi:predicted dehydrogenase
VAFNRRYVPLVQELRRRLEVMGPPWGGADTPGTFQHFEDGRLVEDLDGATVGDGTDLFELSGFYRETAAFLDALASGQDPSPALEASRQSVELAECLRNRRVEIHFTANG